VSAEGSVHVPALVLPLEAAQRAGYWHVGPVLVLQSAPSGDAMTHTFAGLQKALAAQAAWTASPHG
jgi:hypothetical protein